MRTKNGFVCLLVFLVMASFTAGCVTIVTAPQPTPTSTPQPTNTPEPTPTPLPVIVSTGTLDIPQTYNADVDAGIVPTDFKDSAYGSVDLRFEAITPQDRYLEPTNGASWAVMGPGAVGFNECVATPPTIQRVNLPDLVVGTNICLTTNIGNIALVRINAVDLSPVGTIRIDYTTWQKP